jgi:RHS repeat-associated protein
MGIKEREWSDSTFSYRFGFNGKEMDNSIKGQGNSLDFGARIYDSRLGRWLSTDPLQAKYPSLSPYNFGADNPIFNIDPDGEKIAWFASKGVWKYRKALLETTTGTQIWKQMKKAKTRISVHVIDEVLILADGRGTDAITEGITAPRNYETEPENHKNGDYRRAFVYVSLGTLRLKTAVENKAGVTIDQLTTSDANALIQEELKTGAYKIKTTQDNGRLEDYVIEFDTDYGPVGLSGDHGDNDRGERLENETDDEFLQRVGGHEGVHSYNDGKANKDWESKNYEYNGERINATKKSKSLYREVEPNNKEKGIIKEQKSKRVRDAR